MPTFVKTILVLIVLLALGGGAYYYWNMNQNPQPASVGNITPPPANEGSSAASDAAILPSGTDSSDASLDKDLSAVDGNLSSLSSDNTAASASMSDQPVAQSNL